MKPFASGTAAECQAAREQLLVKERKPSGPRRGRGRPSLAAGWSRFATTTCSKPGGSASLLDLRVFGRPHEHPEVRSA